MQVRIPVRDCRVAVIAALEEVRAKLAEDRELHRDRSFRALHDGAVHNGLTVDDARRKEMQEMVDRDIEHMMEQHPANDAIRVFENHLAMINYTTDAALVLDDQDFHMLHKHLPGVKRETVDEQLEKLKPVPNLA